MGGYLIPNQHYTVAAWMSSASDVGQSLQSVHEPKLLKKRKPKGRFEPVVSTAGLQTQSLTTRQDWSRELELENFIFQGL